MWRGVVGGWGVGFVGRGWLWAWWVGRGAGCSPVSKPHEVPWGQTISYVRDLNGCLVEIATPMKLEG